MVYEQKADVVVIPSGPNYEADIARAKVALDHGSWRGDPLYHVAGILRDPAGSIREDAGAYTTQQFLLDSGIDPSQITTDFESEDSLENYLFALPFLEQDNIEVGFSTDPSHYMRFALFNERAKKDGIVGPNFNVCNLPVDYDHMGAVASLKQSAYGHLALQKDRLRIRKGLEQAAQNKTTSGIVQRFKNSLWG